MKKMIRDEKYIETVRIHRSELKDIVFKDHGKEFLYKGEMYDIKDSTTEGDHILFRCVNDKTEKKLLAGLKEQIRNNGGTDSTPGKKQNDSSKNPVKDLYFCIEDIKNIDSTDITYQSIVSEPSSHIPAVLPPPPPEASVS